MGKWGAEWGATAFEWRAGQVTFVVWMHQFTVSEKVVECCREPEVAVTVMVEV
jgi:hypothetical protein